ncbi:MAG: peptidase C25, partial [Bacteroidales bacterium]|nr:peptidase C25 [Bacteroidales bacterium]
MILLLMLGMNVTAQQKIQLNSTRNNAKCEKSDMTSLRATFSFSELEAQDYKSTHGEFSLLSMPNTVMGGDEGDPEIPVVNELIAVPVGATPHIKVKSYRTDDYKLADYGMKTVAPRQPSLRKDKNPDDVPFVYNQAAYEKEGLSDQPSATVEVVGTMRGVRIAKMTIEPVSYDPVKTTVRVFNDIEVEVEFEGGTKKATDDLYTETYSPYFDIVYKQLFNGRAVKDAYSAHPDLYNTPVKMLVITTATFANSTPFNEWLTWKKQKGIDVDVQTVANNATAATIKSKIYSRYNATHPTFLVLVGDETIVTNYTMWDYGSSYGNAASDLEYASVDGDIFHDMFMSRMPVSNITELGNLIHKILTYEKYTMSDPSYLNETLLIAGWDGTWTPKVGKPTIQYANNNYFNAAHGITPHVFLTTGSGQTNCYNYINNVGFVNYTAHGDIQEFADPNFTNTNVDALTNNDQYFWAMGNCCLTANFKHAQNNWTCFGEAMVRA